ncbi:hypothetical protein A6046_04895 [[Haemophilus] ducreyi]|nr:hypothetical protein [[Haemophilus] ducreyi]ANF59817.1 hypothetical protein A6036_00140 [[Haemophilus] ducreyi]ANF63135.1 hypothetical protein A6038_02775 [[Haemophilus] ducreyi]ANF65253.1 hypothetical protein A6039_06625 [[Haemophilus] ducreyi]ANF66131.1 hypothetical protein A6040_03080 [[Haemophilus] ducreyi]ANF70159.1 hypothetical protein A6043_01840 [[Haemophilus] ducreyi]
MADNDTKTHVDYVMNDTLLRFSGKEIEVEKGAEKPLPLVFSDDILDPHLYITAVGGALWKGVV